MDASPLVNWASWSVTARAEFGCPGFNTNSFSILFGGVNKGRPNAEDLKIAEEFVLNLKQNLKKK